MALPAEHLTGFYQQHACDQQTALIEGNRHLTHQQLRQASIALACQIKAKLKICSSEAHTSQTNHAKTVALYDTAGSEMLVAIFACFHLGIPYVPMDPANPLAISKSILKQAKAGLIITTEQQTDLLTMDSGIECLRVDLAQIMSSLSDVSAGPVTDDASFLVQAGADSTAYIILPPVRPASPKGCR